MGCTCNGIVGFSSYKDIGRPINLSYEGMQRFWGDIYTLTIDRTPPSPPASAYTEWIKKAVYVKTPPPLPPVNFHIFKTRFDISSP
jgi:hypothetical protein